MRPSSLKFAAAVPIYGSKVRRFPEQHDLSHCIGVGFEYTITPPRVATRRAGRPHPHEALAMPALT